jgi:murein DD-endopeptidase MepM/ murein hydrolase activator NlpD
MIGAVVAGLLSLSPTCYQQPVSAPVVDPFRAPACSYCPGNRGLEYRPPAGTAVIAAAPGVVAFSGVVAGVRFVVVDQADGRTATYGRLAAADVAVGETVRRGQAIGISTGQFYFGLREGQRYVDPAPFLGHARYRPRLVPADGSRPRPVPPPTMVCGSSP